MRASLNCGGLLGSLSDGPYRPISVESVLTSVRGYFLGKKLMMDPSKEV